MTYQIIQPHLSWSNLRKRKNLRLYSKTHLIKTQFLIDNTMYHIISYKLPTKFYGKSQYIITQSGENHSEK